MLTQLPNYPLPPLRCWAAPAVPPARHPTSPHPHPQELPHWNYDGSSTGQAPGHDSEVHLIPRSIFRDPFR